MTWDELRAEAFGEIGIRPSDFYMMERSDYWLLHKGFFNKRVYDQRVFRRMVMTVIAPWVKNLPSPYQILPLPDDDKLKKEIAEWSKVNKIKVSEKSMEILRKFKEKEMNQKPGEN